MQNKKRILAWADNPASYTGYGTVSKHVLHRLHKEGYEIEQLGINYHAQFIDQNKVPWQIVPARYQNPNDPYGCQMFIDLVKDGDYDYVWILNDYFVVHEVGRKISEIKAYKLSTKQKVPKFIYYYPVDYRVVPGYTGMIEAADYPVAYNQYGMDQTILTLPHLKRKLKSIPHGTDTSAYFPMGKEAQDDIKAKFFNMSPETFLVTTVNRNSVRKQLGYALWMFKEFKKQVKNSVFYLHTMVKDQGGDLSVAAMDLGLNPKEDLIFPQNYSPQNGIPDHVMNQIFNAGDVFLSTALGEGWGLGVTDAMSAGTPVVAPKDSNMTDFFGKNSERGYMYDCNDRIFVDNTGLRPKGNMKDIVGKMIKCYKAGSKWNNNKVRLARAWAEENTWKRAADMWVELFNNIEKDVEQAQSGEIILEELND